ncbi:MAG: ATP-binding protein [Pseudonocardiaceae bacterium]
MTVLFTDLVGSTQLMNLLGERTFEELRQSHLGLLGQITTAHGGVEVKNLGDGVMAVFTAASDAVAAAVAMQQAVQRRGRGAAARLSMRVGLALGDATEYGGDWFGTPVVQAARLVAQCGGGQILVTDTVRTVAQVRTNTHFALVGDVLLRGMAAAVTVWKLDWVQTASPAAVALPGPFQGTEAFGFVGRQTELAALQAAFERAAGGGRQLVLVGGEPGVGKSRLAAEFAREMHAGGTNVLFGRCDDGLAMPYQPFVEALSHYLHHAPSTELPNRLGQLAGELTRLVPELTELVTGLPSPMHADPETERYRLFDAIASWLGAASADEPLLVVLDDLHWATQPTLLLLRHVVRATSTAHLLVVGIYRHTELDPAQSMANLLADLRRSTGVQRLLVEGLDEAEVMTLLEAIGRPLGDNARGLARAIQTHTEGNPFFVGELVRHAVESGTLGGSLEHLGIPEGVKEVVLRRLGRLSATTNQALVTAAVVGAEFDLTIVAAVTGLGENTVAEALEEAMAAGLVKEVTGAILHFRFRHQLVRASLYGCLSTARRQRLHREVGAAIEALHQSQLDEHLPALAYHFGRATAAVAATAVGYTCRAADRALAQLAHDQAAELYAQALALLDDSELAGDPLRRCDLLLALGDAQRRAAHPAHRQTLLAAAAVALQVGATDRLTTAALANVGTYWPGAVDDHERVAVLTAALTAIGEDDSLVRARLLANLADMLGTSEWDRRVELSTEAVAMARRLGDPPTLAQVLVHVFRTLRHPSTLAQRRELVDELTELAAQLGDANVAYSSALTSIGVALEAGDIAQAQHRLTSVTQLADDLAQPALRWMVAVSHAALTILAGRLHEGERLAHQAREVGDSAGNPDAGLFFGAQLLAIRIVQGRLGDLEAIAVDLVNQYPDIWGWRAALALCHCHLDCRDEARVLFQKLTADGFTGRPYNVNWLPGMVLSAEACAQLGDVHTAATLSGLLTPYADQFVTSGPVSCYGSVTHYLGRLAATMESLDEADAHFAAAAAAHARIGAPAWLAHTQLEWAQLLLRRQRRDDVPMAARLLGQARVTARRLGLHTMEQRTIILIDQLNDRV